MEKLGEDILSKIISEEKDMLSPNQPEAPAENDEIYLHTLDLSNFLSQTGISADHDSNLSSKQAGQLKSLSDKVINDLYLSSKGPSIEVGPGPKILQAYKVVTYALLALAKTNQNNDVNTLKKKLQKAKNRNNELQEMYDNLVANSTEGDMFSDRNSSFGSEKIQLEADKIALQTQVEDLQDEISKLRQSQKKAQKLVNTLNDVLYLETTIDSAAEESKKAIIALQNQVASNSSYNESDQFSSAVNEQETVESLNKQVNSMTNDLISLQKHNQELIAQNCLLQDNIKNLEQDKEILEAEIKANTKLTNELNQQIIGKTPAPEKDNSAKMFLMETDLQISKLRYNEVMEESQKRKEKIKNLQRIISEQSDEIKIKESENQNLKMANDKLQVEFDELKSISKQSTVSCSSIDEIEAKNEQIEKLQNAMTELAEQLQLTISDLSEENNTKNQLLTLLHKQIAALEMEEKMVADSRKSEREAKIRFANLYEKYKVLNEAASNNACDHEQVATYLYQHVKADYPSNQLIEQIQVILTREDQSVQDRISEAFDLIYSVNAFPELTKENSQNSDQKSQNDRLLIYLANLTRFVDQIANSGDIQDWLLGDTTPEDFRPRLIAAVARIEAFMRANKLDPDNAELCDSLAHFPVFANDKLEFGKVSGDEEIILVVRQFVLANEILTRFAEELQHRGQLLMGELRQMKDELQRADDAAREKFDEDTLSMRNELEDFKEANERMKDIIDAVEKQLKKSSGDEGALKALAIIENKLYDYDDEEEDGEEDYARKLAAKVVELENEIKRTNEEFEAAILSLKEKNTKKINNLKDKVKELENSNTQLNNSLVDTEERLNNAEAERDELKNNLEFALKENTEIKETLQEQKEHIDQYAEIREKELESIRLEFEERASKDILELNTKIDDLNNKHNEAVAQLRNEQKAAKNAAKEELRKAQEETAEYQKRAKEVRDYYEGMLSDLRAKLAEARNNESKAREDASKAISEAKETKSLLSSTRVDNKMLSMKLSAAEEKFKREKSLMETQFRMKTLTSETKAQSALEEAKSEATQTFNRFLAKVCEYFKEYVDFNSPISEESVVALLKRIRGALCEAAQKTVEMERLFNEVDDIKEMLSLEDGDSISKAVEVLAKKNREFERLRAKIERDCELSDRLVRETQFEVGNANAAREWSEWARRLHAVITDSFSGIHNDRELRYAIEEALMASIGQRQIWRRMEILRAEKVVLTSGALQNIKPMRQSLRPMVAVMAAVSRMQRLSGTQKAHAVSMPRVASRASSAHSSPKDGRKAWPILM